MSARASWANRVLRFVGAPWYPLLVAALAFSDLFLCFVPTELFIVAAVVARPNVWFPASQLAAVGSGLGAVALSALAQGAGRALLERYFPGALATEGWDRTAVFLREHGFTALVAMAAGPLPQQPAVALAGAAGMPAALVGLAVFVGRSIKWALIGYLAAYAPQWLSRLGVRRPPSRDSSTR